ncbi:MAG: tetraacyldisaccharide 4'-kinase [bacterium]|nr:tetraacyldisaccharide 4'-kinase [bacterium]
MSQWLTAAWYRGHPVLWLLWPLSLLYGCISALRRLAYRHGVLSSRHFPVPVLVIGNITVGGTGKTPITLALIERLQREGFRPGVVSRGYGGSAAYPLRVSDAVSTVETGDEPMTIFRRSGVPVVVDPDRSRAVAFLLQHTDCDLVLSDDGLQHYALARDVEIAVIDGVRGIGNRCLLPAGPLREAASRLASVDYVIVNGEGFSFPGAYPMQLVPESWQNLHQARQPLPEPGSRIHAVAGIGNPGRFFTQLRARGFEVIAHAFPDHHAYVAGDFAFADGAPVVMTEKDAVKCMALAADNWWFVPVSADLPEAFYLSLLQQLQATRVNRHA